MMKMRLTHITAASTCALALCLPIHAGAASSPSDPNTPVAVDTTTVDVNTPLFAVAPELGSFEDILARELDETAAIIERLPADRQKALFRELETYGESTSGSPAPTVIPADEVEASTAGSN